jgi:hypothetical protein
VEESFTGNFFTVADGTVMKPRSLLGMSTPTPIDGICPTDGVLFGSPAVLMPQAHTHVDDMVDRSVTFEPSICMRALRGFTEVFKITIAPTLMMLIGVASFGFSIWFVKVDGLDGVTYANGFMYLTAGVFVAYTLTLFASAGVKWVLVGRYRKEKIPLYSCRMFCTAVSYECELIFEATVSLWNTALTC